MNTDAQTINENFDLLALVEKDTKLKRSGPYWIGPCPLCRAGRDRFNLKKTPNGWRWFCRHCGDEKYHSAIDYVMRRDNVDFKQALTTLGGDIQQFTSREQVLPKAPEPMAMPDYEWQVKKWIGVDKASNRLLYQADGKSGRKYLYERGFTRATALTYLLGFAEVYKRPAIVIPWCDVTNRIITAIKYRFIDDQAKEGRRYMMASGSIPTLFGVHAAAGHDVLIFVEGELNAMSIKQVASTELYHIDAISFGGETGGREKDLRDIASSYKHVVVWADNEKRSKAIQASLGRAADALRTPQIDDIKYDANALLQKGWLADFLRDAVLQGATI